jgi:hypothetical protein
MSKRTHRLPLPGSCQLFVCAVPMVFGGNRLIYAKITAAVDRRSCWDKVLKWAETARSSEVMFENDYRRANHTTTAEIHRDMELWARYNPGASRTTRMAWLRRHGCRVVTGWFTPFSYYEEDKHGRPSPAGDAHGPG